MDYERSSDLLGRAKVTQNLAVINRQAGHHAEALDGFLAVLKLSQELGSDYGIALAEIKTLQSILPICANCKKIRDDDGDWHQVESYISARTSTSFSHGICPGCITELYPDFVDEPAS